MPAPASPRPALQPVSAPTLNIKSTPPMSKFDHIVSNYSKKRSHSMNLNTIANVKESDSALSPKTKRARLFKMKLKLAYFKVKTNQTDTTIMNLKLPTNSSKIKKTKLTIHKRRPSELQSFSAPPSMLTFPTPPTFKPKSSSVTSPSKFAMSTSIMDKPHTRSLPPVSKILFEASNRVNTVSPTISNNSDEVTIDNNDSTILQNNDPDSTILQNNNSINNLILISTPVRRQPLQQTQQLSMSKKKFIGSTPIKQKNLLKGCDTDLFSSPTKLLLSTPSSIGAAKSLLQLTEGRY